MGPLTRSTPSRRSLRLPTCTTPPTPPPSTRPSTCLSTPSRPTSFPELPTPRLPPSPTWPPPPLLTSLLPLSLPTPTPVSSDTSPPPTKRCHPTNSTAVQPKNFHLPVHVRKLFSVQKAHFPLVCPVQPRASLQTLMPGESAQTAHLGFAQFQTSICFKLCRL